MNFSCPASGSGLKNLPIYCRNGPLYLESINVK
jgi:hypothetical protein